MEDDERLVFLPDVAVKWNFILLGNPFSEICNTDGKSLPVICLLDTWCDFGTLFKIQKCVRESKKIETFQLSQQHDQYVDSVVTWSYRGIQCHKRFLTPRKNSADFVIQFTQTIKF